VAGFPDLRLLRDLRHVRRHPAALALPTLGPTEPERLANASRVHRVPLGGLVPSFAPAAMSRAQRSSTRGHISFASIEIAVSGRHLPRLPACCHGPHQPGSSRRRIKEFLPLVHLRCTVPPCLPGHGVWLCRRSGTSSGLLPPDLATPRSDCPQLLPAAAAARGGSRNPLGLTAPRGAQ